MDLEIDGISLDCNEFVKFAITPAINNLKNSIKDNQELISKLEPYHSSTYSWKFGLENNSNLAFKHFLFEQSYNLQCSFYLSLSGYYRYSWAALRNYLEMAVFNIDSFENPNKLKQWEKNEDRRFEFTPTLHHIFKKRVEYKKFNEIYNIKEKISQLYKELSSWVHPPRIDKSQSNYYLIDDNFDFLKYDEHFINDWFERTTLCVSLSNLILIIGLYDIFNNFNKEDKENIRSTLSNEQKEALDNYSNRLNQPIL